MYRQMAHLRTYTHRHKRSGGAFQSSHRFKFVIKMEGIAAKGHRGRTGTVRLRPNILLDWIENDREDGVADMTGGSCH